MEIAKANRDILKAFLGTLKGADVASHTRFVFITGVSKFSRVSIFSDLNNLIDITMEDGYADMMGYTHDEVVRDFQVQLENLAGALQVSEEEARELLRGHYDGYRFAECEVQVYNPFSVLRAFRENKLNNYWFETGTPTFLIHLLRERNYSLPDMENMEVTKSIFSVYDLERLGVEALLFQTGYLTVKDVKDDMWRLGYPNLEVKCAFLKHLLYSFTEGFPVRTSPGSCGCLNICKPKTWNPFSRRSTPFSPPSPTPSRGHPTRPGFTPCFISWWRPRGPMPGVKC